MTASSVTHKERACEQLESEEGQNGCKHTNIAKRLRVENQKCARNKEWKVELLGVEKMQENEDRGIHKLGSSIIGLANLLLEHLL